MPVKPHPASITMPQRPVNNEKQYDRTQTAAAEFFSTPKGNDRSEEFIHWLIV
jgi:hypothetical protein